MQDTSDAQLWPIELNVFLLISLHIQSTMHIVSNFQFVVELKYNEDIVKFQIWSKYPIQI